jgi:hypothetical protein
MNDESEGSPNAQASGGRAFRAHRAPSLTRAPSGTGEVMASFWKEPAGQQDSNPMSWAGDTPEERAAIDAARDPEWRYFVRECGFTFQFNSLVEIRHALDWFSQKTHPTSRFLEPFPEWPHGDEQFWKFVAGDRDVAERWYERLPPDLTSNQKRPRVVKALHRAIHEFSR